MGSPADGEGTSSAAGGAGAAGAGDAGVGVAGVGADEGADAGSVAGVGAFDPVPSSPPKPVYPLVPTAVNAH